MSTAAMEGAASGLCGWEPDDQCCPGRDQLPEGVWESSVAAATEILFRLTGAQFGACGRIVRPCHTPCPTSGCDVCPGRGEGPGWRPAIVGGDVYNFSCNDARGCGCGPAVPTLRLPGPVHKVVGVVVDGVELAKDAYAVYDQRELVRLDGKGWPCCQRLDKALTEVGTWGVNYERGKPLSVAGRRALGALACEFTRLCVGDKCRLPSRVTNVSRDGVTWQIDPSTFYAEGLTGITEVDLWIKAVNPYQRQRRASSRNIDRPRPARQRTDPYDVWGKQWP